LSWKVDECKPLGMGSSFGDTKEAAVAAALSVAVDRLLLTRLNFPAANYVFMEGRGAS
jgi:hypothetical protein